MNWTDRSHLGSSSFYGNSIGGPSDVCDPRFWGLSYVAFFRFPFRPGDAGARAAAVHRADTRGAGGTGGGGRRRGGGRGGGGGGRRNLYLFLVALLVLQMFASLSMEPTQTQMKIFISLL